MSEGDAIKRFLRHGFSESRAADEARRYLADRRRKRWRVSAGHEPAAFDWAADLDLWAINNAGERSGSVPPASPERPPPAPTNPVDPGRKRKERRGGKGGNAGHNGASTDNRTRRRSLREIKASNGRSDDGNGDAESSNT